MNDLTDLLKQKEIKKPPAPLPTEKLKKPSSDDELDNLILDFNTVQGGRNCCIYGHPGSGKTSLAATMPGRNLIIDFDKGTVSLKNKDNPAYEKFKKGEVKVIHATEVKVAERILWRAKEQPDWFDNYIIDTVTDMHSRRVTEILRRNYKESQGRRDPYLAAEDVYKEANEYLRRLLIGFSDLPNGFVTLAHHREDKDNSTGRISIGPSISPKLQEVLVKTSDFLGYIVGYVDEESKAFHTRMRVREGNNFKAKTRFSHLPTIIDDPRLSIIFKEG